LMWRSSPSKSICSLVGFVYNFSRIREERIVNSTISYTKRKIQMITAKF